MKIGLGCNSVDDDRLISLIGCICYDKVVTLTILRVFKKPLWRYTHDLSNDSAACGGDVVELV